MSDEGLGPRLKTGPGEDDWVACRRGGTLTFVDTDYATTSAVDGDYDVYNCTCGNRHYVELPG